MTVSSSPVPGAAALARARSFFDHQRYYSIEGGISRKRPIFQYIFRVVAMLSRSRVGNAALMIGSILFYRGFRVPKPHPLFQLGLSFNNERMFRALNEAAGHPEWNDAINGIAASPVKRLLALLQLKLLWSLSGELAARPSRNALAHTQIILTAASVLFYRRHVLDRVGLVCISCDHSPIVIGLLETARQQHIPSCYIQHAPVADYFPTLDYDLAVLFDRESAEIYERAAMNRGEINRAEVVLLPPFQEDFVPVDLPPPPYRIGICLSYLFNEDAVQDLIQILLQKSVINSIFLRRHPACKANLGALLSSAVEECSSPAVGGFLEKCDIILVPNSGVTIECLHKGKPTYYVSGTDDIEDDYYGFVAEGILPRFAPEIFTNPGLICAAFDADWRLRFAKYDPTIETSLESLRLRTGEAFRRLMPSGSVADRA